MPYVIVGGREGVWEGEKDHKPAGPVEEYSSRHLIIVTVVLQHGGNEREDHCKPQQIHHQGQKQHQQCPMATGP